MISMGSLAAEAIGRGEDATALLDRVPAWQFRIWFADLAAGCPDRACPDVQRRPANALNVEIGAPLPRCKRQSPDGRGLAWLLSGGDILAYGTCQVSACPRGEGA